MYKLKRVIKRDGHVEPFDINKLKGWARWAGVGLNLNWGSKLASVLKSIDLEIISTAKLNEILVDQLEASEVYDEHLMAGRLVASDIRKDMFPNGILPSVRELYMTMLSKGLAEFWDLSEEDWAFVEATIDHSLDMTMSSCEIKQIVMKYAIKNVITREVYETPQFVYMRMAIALALGAENLYKARLISLGGIPPEVAMPGRHELIRGWYKVFSHKRLSAPTPNYLYLGTPHHGLASCCLIVAGDTIGSLTTADLISTTSTARGCGIGSAIVTRSVGDPVQNGRVRHMGKMPYYDLRGKSVKANTQSGRGGACTDYFSAYDPECMTIIIAQNPSTPADKQNKMIHFAAQLNKFLIRKALLNEQVFLFNCHTAPDLHSALYDPDSSVFADLYHKYENDPTFKKTYLNAANLVTKVGTESIEVSTLYVSFVDEVNRHTPYKEKIYLGNLCTEVYQVAKPYSSPEMLYKFDENDGETSMCSLGAVAEPNITSDEEYEETAFFGLLMIDVCIHTSVYAFPNIAWTAKNRMNAGLGMMGNAYSLAKEGLSITTVEGLNKVHRMAERHAYFALEASLKLGKILGNAPWIHKTKWPEGWTWLETYNRNTDEIHTQPYLYDWENIRQRVIDNKGIRNSVLINFMPGESSSKALGLPNSVYLLIKTMLSKTDEGNSLAWCAPQPKGDYAQYELAFDVDNKHHINMHSLYQKFCDSGGSFDLYERRIEDQNDEGSDSGADTSDVIMMSQDKILRDTAQMCKLGWKSRYYMRTKTFTNEEIGKCGSGGCSL